MTLDAEGQRRPVARPADPQRRRLLPGLGRELHTLAGLVGGGRAFQTADLARLPDDQLRAIVPALDPRQGLFSDGEYLCRRDPSDGAVIRELTATPDNVLACSLIDGFSTLGQIGERLAVIRGWEAGQGYALVRDVFLRLARHGVAVPANPLDEQGR